MVMLFVVPLIYHGMLMITHNIHDPFGEDILDFPIVASLLRINLLRTFFEIMCY